MLFTEQNGKVVVAPELKMLGAFADILKADKDKFKERAMKNLAYVYFMADFRSSYFNTHPTERSEKVQKDLRIELTKAEEKLCALGIVLYCERQETPLLRALKEVKESLTTSSRVIGKMRDAIESQLDRIDLDNVVEDFSMDEEDTGDGAPRRRRGRASAPQKTPIELAMDMLTQLFVLSEKFPKLVESIRSLEEKAKIEMQAEAGRLKGGGVKALFEE